MGMFFFSPRSPYFFTLELEDNRLLFCMLFKIVSFAIGATVMQYQWLTRLFICTNKTTGDRITLALNYWLQVINHVKFANQGIKPGICVTRTAPAVTNVTSKLQSTSKRTPSHLEQPKTIMITGVFRSWYLTKITLKYLFIEMISNVLKQL